MAVEIIKLYGSIELALGLGMIVLLILFETGETMKQNGL